MQILRPTGCVHSLGFFSGLWLLILLLPIVMSNKKEVKVFKRGKVELVDETQFQWPADYSQDFEAELGKNPEIGDIYDEQLAELPSFELHKNGKNLGWTRLAVVKRKKAYWSTPLPRTRPGDQARTSYSTPRLDPITLRPEEEEAAKPLPTTPMPVETTKKTAATIQRVPESTASSRPVPTGRSEEKPSRLPLPTAKTKQTTQGPSPAISRAEPTGSSASTSSRKSATSSRVPSDTSVERESALERLRKKLLILRPVAARPTEVLVKSNKFTIRTRPVDLQTVAPTPGGFAWSRSWSIGPDGRMVVRTWDRQHGERVEQRIVPPGEKGKWLGTSARPVVTPSTASSRRMLKPAFIQTGTHRHSGPTFDCRVLDAAVDGQPSGANDPDCAPSNGSCKCTFQVRERDSKGCASGFIYTCAKKQNLAVAASEEPFVAVRQRLMTS